MSDPVEACGFTLSEWQHHYQTRPAGERLACVSATIETLIAGLNPDDNGCISPRRRSASSSIGSSRSCWRRSTAISVACRCSACPSPSKTILTSAAGQPAPPARRSPIRLRRTPPWSPTCAPPERSPSVKPTSTSLLPGWWAPAHLMARWSTASTAATSAAVPAPAPPRWWRAAGAVRAGH